METHKALLSIGVWILFVQGAMCIGIAMALFLLGRPVVEFAVHGLGGAASIIGSSVVAVLRRKL